MTKISRNAHLTKEHILEAAEELFAKNGFAGTSLSEIARASGASGPLIVFHFKDKQGLYKAVKAKIITRYIESDRKNPPENESFQAFLEHLLLSMFQFYRDNPTMMRLANWGRLEGDIDPWPGEDALHHAYCHRIHQAQEQGEIRDDLTPLHISIMVCGAVHFWWEYHDHFLKHLKTDSRDANADDFFFQQCLAFILQGLSKKETPEP